MKVVLLAPRRRDRGWRDQLWANARARWSAILPDVPIVEGHHDDGPFNRAAAINSAARTADEGGRWDVGIVIDSDVLLRRSQVLAAVDRAAEGYVTWAHLRWREFHESFTRRIITDRQQYGPEFEDIDVDLLVERTNPISWSCCIAIPRATFDAMGGFDERFRGWGFEDGAWAAHVRALYPWDRIETVPGSDRPADVLNLWHPRSPERIVLGESALTASVDYIRNALLGRRYMVAAIRDHRSGDQLGEERLPEAMAAVHVANLTRDDRRFLDLAATKGMPEARWADWWPTLEELAAGARERIAGPEPGVAVIVRTGGEPETWADRVAYLRTSLESLDANLRGPIAMRRIYSDWGVEHRAELEAIASPRGYRVVGPDHHLGYTGAVQALWGYVERNVSADFLFLAEDDFIYERPVDLAPMIETMRRDPALRQVALLRDPYPAETERGGILGWPSETFEARDRGNGHGRLEHRNFWTMNPSLTRRSIVSLAWPSARSSERVFGDLLFRTDPEARVALWGDGEPWVRHIGKVRSASAY